MPHSHRRANRGALVLDSAVGAVSATVSTPPRHCEKSDAVTYSRSTAPPTLENLSIVVVDDDPEARLALGAILELAAARVWIASSVRAALEVVSSNRPDVVLTDLVMPGRDGYDLLRGVRAIHSDNVAVIALSGAIAPEQRQKVIEAGFTLSLTKPVDPMEVLSAVGMAAAGLAAEFAAQRATTR
jgi:CheY-like chemotaxis protein